jgi:hypothetical protein
VKYYEGRNKDQGWDGRDLNGTQSPGGTYFYTVRIGERSYSGNITLIE